MASLHNRNGTYYATFSDSNREPRQRRLSLKTTNKRLAERLLLRLHDAYREGRFDPWTQRVEEVLYPYQVQAPKRVGEGIKEYLAYAEETLSPSTLPPRRSTLKWFAAHVGGGTFLARLTPEQIESYIKSGAAARSSQRTRLIVLRAFCTFCVEREMMKESPAHKVTPPKKPEKLPRAVTDEELEAVLSNLPEGRQWTIPVFRFASLTGLRVSELARLRWADVDSEKRMIRIEQQKNAKAQTQPIPCAAVTILDGLPHRSEYVFASPAERTPQRNVDVWKKELALAFKIGRENAGLARNVTPHGLRHRYCTKLAEAGASAFVIQAAARHADVSTSQRYVSIANRSLQAALDEVFS